MKLDKPTFDHPSISIIVPAYNEEKCIRDRIENLLGFDYPKDKLEIVIVDDGSIDKTSEIAKQYPVKVIRIEHSGPAKAKNVGLEHATGELVSIQDANDLTLDRDYLKKIETAYLKAEKTADAIAIKAISYPLNKSVLSQSIFAREHFRDVYWDSQDDVVARKFNDMRVLRREFFLKMGGYDSKLGAFEDMCMRYKLAQHKPKIIQCDDVTYEAEGGAIINLVALIERHTWRSKAILGVWAYNKKQVLKIALYSTYFGLLLAVLIATFSKFLSPIVGTFVAVPLIIYTLTRTFSILIRVKQLTVAGLMPLLDFLHGFSVFLGFTKGLVYKVWGRYTPYR